MKQASNRYANEHWLVALGTAAMQKTGNLFTANNTANIGDGELGVVSADPWSGTRDSNVYLQGGETPATVGKIKLIVGTSGASNLTNYKGWNGLESDKPYQETDVINPDVDELVSVYSALPGFAKHSSVLYSGFTTPVVGGTYGIYPKLRSIEIDRDQTGKEWNISESVTIPSSVSSGFESYAICNLVHQLNLQSKYVKGAANINTVGKVPMLALALDADGGGSGTAIGALQVGDTVNFMVVDGANVALTITNELLNTMNEWIASSSITASTEIVNVNLANATTLAADMFVLVGLTHDVAAAHDDIVNNYVTVTAQLSNDWSNAGATTNYTQEVLTEASIDEGDPRNLGISFDSNGRLQVNRAVAGHTDDLVLAPSYIDTTKRYAIRRINFKRNAKRGSKRHHNWSIVILGQVTSDASTTDVSTGITVSAANAQFVTDLNAILGVWLKAYPNLSGVKYLGSSSASTLFV